MVHAVALVVALPALGGLIVATDLPRARAGVVVYAAGMCAMFAVSATYHRVVRRRRARAAWRRADHATIFAAIAGSATPIALVGMGGAAGWVVVAVTWASSGVGAWCELATWHGGDRAGSLMYGVVSVVAAVALPATWVRAGALPAALIVAGGVVYLLGAACFAARRPVLAPTAFSYHEVWHVATVVAATLHFAAIARLVTTVG